MKHPSKWRNSHPVGTGPFLLKDFSPENISCVRSPRYGQTGLPRVAGVNLFVTHDLSLLLDIADAIAIMYAGRLVEPAPAGEILRGPRHPYTQGLTRSFPGLTGEKVRMSGIPGSPPDLADLATGCRFRPRCPKAMAHCRTEDPVWRSDGVRGAACHLVEGMGR